MTRPRIPGHEFEDAWLISEILEGEDDLPLGKSVMDIVSPIFI